jgi:hypothetical protein
MAPPAPALPKAFRLPRPTDPPTVRLPNRPLDVTPWATSGEPLQMSHRPRLAIVVIQRLLANRFALLSIASTHLFKR